MVEQSMKYINAYDWEGGNAWFAKEDGVWEKVSTYYNLHEGGILRAIPVPHDINASKIFFLKMLMNVDVHNTDVCVCRQCMEKALGHSLCESDLNDGVLMNKNILNELKMASA